MAVNAGKKLSPDEIDDLRRYAEKGGQSGIGILELLGHVEALEEEIKALDADNTSLRKFQREVLQWTRKLNDRWTAEV